MVSVLFCFIVIFLNNVQKHLKGLWNQPKSRRKHYPPTAAQSWFRSEALFPDKLLLCWPEMRRQIQETLPMRMTTHVNACTTSHHSSHFTVTGHLSCVCQPVPPAKHEVSFDWASSEKTWVLHVRNEFSVINFIWSLGFHNKKPYFWKNPPS